MRKLGFREMLGTRQKEVNSLVSTGLDPLLDKMPEAALAKLTSDIEGHMAFEWMRDIVDATAPFTCMYKPQSAHWESLNGGKKALSDIGGYIHETYPEILFFVDCKRGDIGRTQRRYALAHLGIDGGDGMNYSPYMGKDCLEALAEEKEVSRGATLVGLCYTSNPAAREVQNVIVKTQWGEMPYWEFIARKIFEWASDLNVLENAGLVMAAAHKDPDDDDKIVSYHLSRIREIFGDKLWFLIPGIGAQGGFVEETVRTAFAGPGSISINSSSGITFASEGDDYIEAAAGAAEALRDQIRSAGGSIV